MSVLAAAAAALVYNKKNSVRLSVIDAIVGKIDLLSSNHDTVYGQQIKNY